MAVHQESDTHRTVRSVTFSQNAWVPGCHAHTYGGGIEYESWLEYAEDFGIEIERCLVELANLVAARGCNYLTGTQVDIYPNAPHEGREMTRIIIKGTMVGLRIGEDNG
jgi:hypothetical protein